MNRQNILDVITAAEKLVEATAALVEVRNANQPWSEVQAAAWNTRREAWLLLERFDANGWRG